MIKNYLLLFTLFSIHYSFSQINSDVDPDFNFSTNQTNGEIRNLVIQPDNKILVGGFISQYPSNKSHFFRLNTDGSIDSNFNIPNYVDLYNTYCIALQSDNKIIVGAEHLYGQIINNISVDKKISRFNSNGRVDNTFSVGSGFDKIPLIIKIQQDGKILIGGEFSNYNGTTKNKIIRLNPNGSIDDSFDIGTGFDGNVKCIEIQSDGKILVGGEFNTYKGINKKGLIRLNSDGSIDNYFYIGIGPNNNVNCITIQNDNKILVAGKFLQFNNTSASLIVRLTSSGNIDATFNIWSGFSASSQYFRGSLQINSILQSGSNLLVAGNFEKFNNKSKEDFVSLNINGSEDSSFNIGLGFVGTTDDIVNRVPIEIKALALQNGKLLASGNFKYYNSIGKAYIIRLFGNSLSIDEFSSITNSIYPNPVIDIINIPNTINTESTTFEIYNLLGQNLLKGNIDNSVINVASLPKGIYLLKTTNGKNTINQKFIKE